MSSVDQDTQEPFKLCIESIQGRWMCEELGAALIVTERTVQYASGECYPIDVTPEGKLEIFGYRGLEKKSDASSVVWRHKENGKYLTWMYEGDVEDHEPEVDTSLIIQGSSGRTTRKRKVDYVALDKELDKKENLSSSKQGLWDSQYASLKSSASSSQGPSEDQIQFEFSKLKSAFHNWIVSTDTNPFKEIMHKRGYLSTEFAFVKLPAAVVAANRFATYVKSLGARAMIAQAGIAISIRVPELVWKELIQKSATEVKEDAEKQPSADPALLKEVLRIRDQIVTFCEGASQDIQAIKEVESALSTLESLPVDLEILKLTKIGIEINKLSRVNERSKSTLAKLKEIYIQSKSQ